MGQTQSTIRRFVAYDIAPVAEFEDGSCEQRSSLAQAREASDSTFWSLYGITSNRQILCIGDFCTYERAAEIYQHITGRLTPANPGALRLVDLPAGL